MTNPVCNFPTVALELGAKDVDLQNQIKSEVAERTDADETESNTRASAVQDLQAQINALKKTECVPVGAVEYFARTTAPQGWLKADGSAVSRTQYSDLFAAVGTMFGVGDGSTTFKLPDLRGEFVRGFDDGRGVDSGRILGSAQKGSLSVNDPNLTSVNVTSLISVDDTTNLVMNQRIGLDNPVSISDYTGLDNAYYNASTGYQSVVTNPAGFNFGITRPRNIALLACIKY